MVVGRAAAVRRIAFSVALAFAAIFSTHGRVVEARRAAPTPSPAPSPTPTPTPLPTPPGFDARIARLGDQLNAIAKTTPGTIGIAVFDQATDTHVSVHGDTPFPLAETYDLAVALTAFHRADERKLDLNRLVPVSANDLRRGYSPIAERYPKGGVSLPLWKLLRAMLVDGDTTATGLVVRAIGDSNDVRHALDALKLAGFSTRKTSGTENAGTPDGVAALLLGTANLKYLSLDSTTEFLLDLSLSHAGDSRLRAGFAPHTPFGHRAGSTEARDGTAGTANDAGLLTLPDGHRVAIVVFVSASTTDGATRDAVFENIAKLVYAAFAPA